MERTIKFRGKDENGEWVYGNYLPSIYEDVDIITVLEDFNLNQKNYAVLKETVGEFTGRTDKNGKEIYEGDIVEVLDTRMAVTYVNSSFRLRECTLACYDTKSIEVIGNIHDNGNLLKK